MGAGRPLSHFDKLYVIIPLAQTCGANIRRKPDVKTCGESHVNKKGRDAMV